MPKLSPVTVYGTEPKELWGYRFLCPGCTCDHSIPTVGPNTWGFNGDLERPTFTPSLKVTYGGPDADTAPELTACCHSFIEGGRIRFLGDCTHALKDQTVDLPEAQAEVRRLSHR